MTLEDLGLNARLLVAGFAGGVVHALVFKQSSPSGVIASVLTGTLTANYLAPVVSHYLGDWLGVGGCAFVVGLAAMAICQALVGLINTKLKGDSAKETRP